MERRAFTVLALATLVLAACGSGDGTAGGDGPVVVVTTSILGDVVEELVGDDASVTVLMPRDADPHSFEPSARQRAELSSADLVVANGLGLEEGLVPVLEEVQDEGVPVVEVAPAVDPIRVGSSGSDDGHDEDEEGHDVEDEDPHFWMDPLRMADGIAVIGSELGSVDDSVDWDARVVALRNELEDLDAEIVEILRPVPPERRVLVTNHDALGYFAPRYDFEIVGVIIPGGSTLAEPAASDLDELAAELEETGVQAVFVETTQPADLAESLAAEVGADVEVVELYTGSLGDEGSGADTYAGMLRTDAERIAVALS